MNTGGIRKKNITIKVLSRNYNIKGLNIEG